MEEALRPIFERRSCRSYLNRPVSDETLELLLRAGMAAPSAMNSQPWEFIVLRDESIKAAISAIGPHWGMLKYAPLGILVLANIEGYRATRTEFFVQDCSACTQNILLAAQALGLGGVWLGLYPHEQRMQEVRRICGIPQEVMPVSLVSIGYPDNRPAPRDSYIAEKVHTDRY